MRRLSYCSSAPLWLLPQPVWLRTLEQLQQPVRAVQGQTAAQPEGAFLNAVNWVCNVICPVGAGIAVVATVLQWRSGRSWLPSALTAGGLICVSGILRLIEYFIQQGQAVA
jgi:hypothetical protein